MNANTTSAAEGPQDFSRRWVFGWKHDKWFFQLVAIEPDTGEIDATAAPVSKIDTLAGFIDQYNGKRNLYFAVNPLLRNLCKKAKKEHVAAGVSLHVDLDPAKDKDFATERERIKKVIADFPLRPSVIIDSGGGFQVFWILAEPVAAENAERMNQALAAYLGGDACWNIDRIMRLPGTKNLPNEEKRKAGRMPTLARVVEWNDARYRLEYFTFLPPAPATPTTPRVPVEIDLGAINEAALVARLEAVKHWPDLDKLLHGEPTRWMKDTSRNGFDFALALVLAQFNFSDDDIACLLLEYPAGKAWERDDPERYIGDILAKVRVRFPRADDEEGGRHE